MSPPTLVENLVTQTNEDWVEEFQFFHDDLAHPDNLAGLLVEAAIELKTRVPVIIKFSTATGEISVSANSVVISVPASRMMSLVPGNYEFDLRVTRTSGAKEILARGLLVILAGITA